MGSPEQLRGRENLNETFFKLNRLPEEIGIKHGYIPEEEIEPIIGITLPVRNIVYKSFDEPRQPEWIIVSPRDIHEALSAEAVTDEQLNHAAFWKGYSFALRFCNEAEIDSEKQGWIHFPLDAGEMWEAAPVGNREA